MSRSYSYSMIQQAYRCSMCYKFLYIDKLLPETKQSADLTFGSAIHFALEQFFLHKTDPVEAFKVYWSKEVDKLEYGRCSKEILESNADVLLTRFARLHAKKINVNQMEQRLFGAIGDVKVEGTPDVLGSFEGIPAVIDFKTSGYRYNKERIVVNEQMYLYAHLASQNGFTAKQVVYIVFIKGTYPSIQVLTKTITTAGMKKVLDNISKQCKNLDMVESNNSWTYNSQCCQQGCPFYNRMWETKNE